MWATKRLFFFCASFFFLLQCALVVPKIDRKAVPVEGAVLAQIADQLGWVPFPNRLRALSAISFKLPRHADTFFEGPIWLGAPGTVSFEAVNDFGNTLFYLRYVKDRGGWVVEYGEAGEENVGLPVDGETLFALMTGHFPHLWTDQVKMKSMTTGDLIVIEGRGEKWGVGLDGTPRFYQKTSGGRRRAYLFEWLAFKEVGGRRIPTRVRLSGLHGRLELLIDLYEVDVK